MRVFTIALLAMFVCSSIFGQNLIGMDENEIKKHMKDHEKDFNLQNENNSLFRYLKYADNRETETRLFFLSDKSVCTEVRIICDLNLKNQKIKEFDSKYQISGKNIWTETKKNQIYEIELKDEEWYFSINIKTKE